MVNTRVNELNHFLKGPFQMKPKDEYTPPAVAELGDKEPAVGQAAVAPAAVKTEYQQPGKVTPSRLGIAQFLNAKGTAVSDVMKARIDRHMAFISGKEGFNNPEEKATEQGTFIELMMNTLEMDFDQYAIVTDHLLTVLREKTTELSGTQMRRFMTGLDPKFDRHKAQVYGEYVTFLTKIALNWTIRYKLNRLIDASYAVRELSPKGKQNVLQYFSKLMVV